MGSVRVPNFGLLQGLAAGANSFLNSWQTEKQAQYQKRKDELLTGLERDPDGNLVASPRLLAMQQAQQAQAQATAQGFDPNSDRSQEFTRAGKALGIDLPEGTSADIGKQFLGYSTAREKLEGDPATQLLKQLKAKKEIKALAKPDLTPGEIARDQAFGKEYEDYAASGGYSGVEKNLKSAEDALGLMQSGKVKTGGFTGILPKGMRDVVNPEMSKTQEALEQTVQSSLKAVLGAQFTEKEGAQIMSRTFNPRLPTEENIKRAQALIEDLRKRAIAKEQASKYFEGHQGSLSGYKGSGLIGAGMRQSAQPSGIAQAVPQASAAHPADNAAVQWAKANPNDPRSVAIMKANGL